MVGVEPIHSQGYSYWMNTVVHAMRRRGGRISRAWGLLGSSGKSTVAGGRPRQGSSDGRPCSQAWGIRVGPRARHMVLG